MKTELEIATKQVRNALKRVIDETEKTVLRKELKRLKSLKTDTDLLKFKKVGISSIPSKEEKLSA